MPLRFYNDAACFGIGEAWKGKLISTNKSLAITLGTGFGATFLVQGKPVVHGEGVAENGELYNVVFKEGIADEYFSTRWFIKRHEELTGITVQGVKDLITISEGNTHIDQIFNEFSKNLGTFLSPWLKEFNADAIVIGGNISKAWNLFAGTLKQELENQGCFTEIYQSDLKEKAILLGGARLVNDTFYTDCYTKRLFH